MFKKLYWKLSKYSPLKLIISITLFTTCLVGLGAMVLLSVFILMEKYDDRYLGSENMQAEEDVFIITEEPNKEDPQNVQGRDRWDLLIPKNNQ
jgi:hypothetical protein